MKKTFYFFARNSIIYLTTVVLITTITLTFVPVKSFAISLSEEMEDDSFVILEIIEFTDKEVVYKTLENGDLFLYEEQIENEAVTTSKYKIENMAKELVENFITIIDMNEDDIFVSQKNILSNQIISKTSVNVSPVKEIKNDKIVYKTSTTGKWVTARASGFNYSYYKYNNGGGKARELSNEKTVNTYNKYFDQFTRNVDKIRNFETSILKELLLVGLLDQAFKSIKKPTVANVTNFLRKYLKSIPGISVIVASVEYLILTNKTLNSYKKIPGPEHNWRFGKYDDFSNVRVS